MKDKIVEDVYTQVPFYTLEGFQQWILNNIQNNELFFGMAGTAVLTSLLYLGRNLPSKIFTFVERKILVEVVLTNDDPAFEWFTTWLEKAYGSRANRLKFESDPEREWKLSPGYGLHWFFYKGKFFLIDRKRESEASATFRSKETLTVQILWPSKKFLRNLIWEIYTFRDKDESKTRIKKFNQFFYSTLAKRTKRPLSTVVCPQKYEIIQDIENFWGNKEFYLRRGIPYHKRYGLFGKPGTGKTSLVFGLASYFNVDVCVIQLDSIEKDEELVEAFSKAEDNFILLEDIDAIDLSNNRSNNPSSDNYSSNSNNSKNISLSGLLNVLDGALSPEGQIAFITTNHPEKLDSALTRSERIDKIIHLDYCSRAEKIEFFDLFFGTQDNSKKAQEFADSIQKEVVAADLQSICLKSNSPDQAIKLAQEKYGAE